MALGWMRMTLIQPSVPHCEGAPWGLLQSLQVVGLLRKKFFKKY